MIRKRVAEKLVLNQSCGQQQISKPRKRPTKQYQHYLYGISSTLPAQAPTAASSGKNPTLLSSKMTRITAGRSALR